MKRMMGKAHRTKTCPYGCCAADMGERITKGGRHRTRYTKECRAAEQREWRKAELNGGV